MRAHNLESGCARNVAGSQTRKLDSENQRASAMDGHLRRAATVFPAVFSGGKSQGAK
jgi:hypothetical protein